MEEICSTHAVHTLIQTQRTFETENIHFAENKQLGGIKKNCIGITCRDRCYGCWWFLATITRLRLLPGTMISIIIVIHASVRPVLKYPAAPIKTTITQSYLENTELVESTREGTGGEPNYLARGNCKHPANTPSRPS